jgi:hypothetical protein
LLDYTWRNAKYKTPNIFALHKSHLNQALQLHVDKYFSPEIKKFEPEQSLLFAGNYQPPAQIVFISPPTDEQTERGANLRY